MATDLEDCGHNIPLVGTLRDLIIIIMQSCLKTLNIYIHFIKYVMWRRCLSRSLFWKTYRMKCMGLLPDTQNCGLRMRRECREPFPRHRGLTIPACLPGSLTHGFLWRRWWGKRSRHSRRTRNPYLVRGPWGCVFAADRFFVDDEEKISNPSFQLHHIENVIR